MQAKLLLIVIEYLFTGLLKFHIEGYICLDSHLKKPRRDHALLLSTFPPSSKTSVSLDTPIPQEHNKSPSSSYTDTLCRRLPKRGVLQPKRGKGKVSLVPTCWVFLNGSGAEDQLLSSAMYFREVSCMPTRLLMRSQKRK